jgi:hypothetical protein
MADKRTHQFEQVVFVDGLGYEPVTSGIDGFLPVIF